MRSLRGAVSGLCQPTYVLDIPGGHGKVPVGPCYAHAVDDEVLAHRRSRRGSARLSARLASKEPAS